MDTDHNISFLIESTNETSIDSTVPDWCQFVLITYMVITAVLAVSGNGVIILVERRNRCKTSTDWLVCFMAANDMTFAIINIPALISLQLVRWQFLGSDVLCKVHIFVERTTMYSSTLLLCIVALDRFWKTCRPYRQFLTPQRALKVCIFVTFASCVICSPNAVIGSPLCTEVHVQVDSAVTKAVTSMVTVTYVIMFLVVGICYTKVALTIRHKLLVTCGNSRKSIYDKGSKQIKNHSENLFASATTSVECQSLRKLSRNNKVMPVNYNVSTQDTQEIETQPKETKNSQFENNTGLSVYCHQKQRVHNSDPDTKLMDIRVNRTTKIMFGVTLAFILSWMPTWMVVLYKQIKETDRPLVGEVLAFFGQKSFMINAFTNPVFYIWLSTAFKQRAKQLVKNVFTCQGRR